MILFEHEDADNPLPLTNDQFFAINELINEFGWSLDYDVIPHENSDVIHLWVHHGTGQNPTRHHINADGHVFLHEDVDWDWMGVERKRS